MAINNLPIDYQWIRMVLENLIAIMINFLNEVFIIKVTVKDYSLDKSIQCCIQRKLLF